MHSVGQTPPDAKGALDGQQEHWESVYAGKPGMFGESSSEPARKATDAFQAEGAGRILELGCGPGRDTLLLARSGFHVTALDYSQVAINLLMEKARTLGLGHLSSPFRHDVRDPLPFAESTFDGCYSHMLFCMALITAELECLFSDVWRVLKPGGLCIYTVRHSKDPWYGTGINRGEDIYEVGGFVVHFFTWEKVIHLSKGYLVRRVDEFDEGDLPRKLFRVTLRKEADMESGSLAALTEFKRYKGKLNQELPQVMAHVDGLFQASLTPGALSLKEKELIVLGIAVATHCEPCILVHMEKALAAGVTKAEILEACGVAMAMGGGPAMAYVPLVLKFLEDQG